MLFHVALCLVALASVASANRTANAFMDDVLNEMTVEARHRDLDPLSAKPFAIKVKSTSFGNRDLKANFTHGSFVGLSGIRRLTDCSYARTGFVMTMRCPVSLGTVRVDINADVKGDSLIGTRHAISTSSVVLPDTYALFEISGHLDSHRAELKGVSIDTVNMKTSVGQGKLDLNSSRYNKFVSQVNGELSNQLSSALRGPYSLALQTLLSRRAMPPNVRRR